MKTIFIMDDDDLLYLIALKKTEMVGDITAKKLIGYFGSAKNVFNQPKQTIEKVPGVGDKISDKLLNPKWLKEAEIEMDFCRKNHIQIVTYLDADYPEYLRQCADSPVVFYRKGNIDLKNKRILAVVGTRQCSNYGMGFIDEFVKGLSHLPVVIVSGFAYGIDITAHKAAIRHNVQTVACLAHGLNIIYPPVHAKYCTDMMQNGGFITDFGFLSPFNKANFLSRNRIIAGLAEATVVIETNIRGGSLVTTSIASSYGRPVFALPGKVTDMSSAGCNLLIHDNRAQALISAEQLIEDLKWDAPKPQAVQQELFVSLTEEEEMVLQYLKTNGKMALDDLTIGCGMPVFMISNILFQLELKGVVRSFPGKVFEGV